MTRRFLSSVLTSALLLVGLGCGCSSKDGASATASPSATAAAQQAVGEAGKAYLHFEQTLAQAKSLDDIKPLLAAEKRQAIEQMGSQAEALLPVLKAAQEKDIMVKGEDVQGAQATITVESNASKATGTATMVQEEGAWKLLEEEWDATEGAAQPSATPAE